MILSKLNLVENIVNEISDNSIGQISPHDIRHNLLDIIDSVHLLTIGQNLRASNFETPSNRTTRAGELTLQNLGLDGYSSTDNSAFGYSSLKANYQGIRNTAVGSYSLSCNIYGEDNVAVGHQALAGNSLGYANVGIGNYSLNNQKVGNFNIAIGHGAGYYVDRDTHSKLFIGSHPVDGDYICDNPLGSGLTPLVYGDLSSLKFGLAVNNLHSYGTLQVSGNITPSENDEYDLGHDLYRYKSLLLSSGIDFGGGSGLIYSNSGITSNTDLLPAANKVQSIGNLSSFWRDGYFENLHVSGLATIRTLVTISDYQYLSKTIYLATSGVNASGYLNDDELLGAGFIVNASGSDYLRQYKFTFGANRTQHCETNDTYSTLFWNSNISLHFDSGKHIEVDRIVSNPRNNLAVITPSSCYGLYVYNSEKTFISRKENLLSDVPSSSGHLAGITNINYLSTSGSLLDYGCTIGAMESGVTVSQKFLTGIKKRSKDSLNNNKDKLSGFEFRYIDDSLSNVQNTLSDRLIIGSYNNTSEFVNGLTVMKNSPDGGVVGITNLAPYTQAILPETMLNLRAVSNCVARLTAENNGNTKASLQLLGGTNCLDDGAEFEYSNASGHADISMYKASKKSTFLRFKEDGQIGLLSSGITNAVLTIGYSGMPELPAISLRDNQFIAGSISSSANYGKLYNLRTVKTEFNQYNSLYFMDGSGNSFNLVINAYDTTDGRSVYSDDIGSTYGGNTFAGIRCPNFRNSTFRRSNTGFGTRAIYNLLNGSYNSAFGTSNGIAITNGYKNTILGSHSADSITVGHNNIVIGHDSFNNTNSGVYNNIIIGNNGVGSGLNSNYNFMVGHDSVLLLEGILGPTNNDKILILPSGGKLSIKDSTNTDSLLLKTNTIEVTDGGGNNYPDNQLVFKFSGNNSADLLLLNHSADPMSNAEQYEAPTTSRPFTKLNGDLKLRGSVRFSDNTSLSSASFLSNISTLETEMDQAQEDIATLQNSFIEGYVPQQILPPSNAATATSGLMTLKNANWQNGSDVFLSNRDTTSLIHAGAYVIAIRVNNEYRPIWISASNTDGICCNQ